MRKYTFILSIIFASVIIAGCGGNPETPANGNAKPAVNASPASSPATDTTTSSPAPVAVENNAPTLSKVYTAYCEARVKKDEAAIKKLLSKDTLKHYQEQMEAEGMRTLNEFLELEEVSTDVCSVINEKINGDSAVARITAKWAPQGIDVVFVKEDGEWKLTNRNPQMDANKK